MHEQQKIIANDVEINLNMSASLAPSVLRAFLGTTPLDTEVDTQQIPKDPFWLNKSIRALRWYRRIRPLHIGHRCVLDPSCSRYSELAFRRWGLFRGVLATLKRLQRCKPGAGGVDLP